MAREALLGVILALVLGWPARPQDAAEAGKKSPLYKVTVVERTVRAVDYRYRNGPTKIDFKGTVLLPAAKGEATVESKAGRAQIAAKLEHLTNPQKFGAQFLTYVLWAVSPEGHAKNLGELIPGGSDAASINVTTDLQAFGLIVTAEPYSAVRQPSDVVVAENEIRKDTVGQTEPVAARYELLPRSEYTYTIPDQTQPAGPKVSLSRYETTMEIYQAQNAIQIARSQGAERYAMDVYQKAATLLNQAQDLNLRKGRRDQVVTLARQAEETAEDARLIAAERARDAQLEAAKAQAAAQRQAQAAAEARASADQAALEQARAEAQTAEQGRLLDEQALKQERAARGKAEAEVQALEHPAAPPAPATLADPDKTKLREALLRQLDGSAPTLDTPRGLTVTIAGSDFEEARPRPAAAASLAGVAAALAAHPGLTVEVDGYAAPRDDAAEQRLAYERAMAVRDALVRDGVPAGSIAMADSGNERPVADSGTPAGRERNRRVEIVISGDAIGNLASWEDTYVIAPGR
ncbi:MAG TPA: OmpA family protein [Bryobacteraceae bacterium]|nr:OmpA family protein [Bryobacteraceae bacterium]